MQGWLERNQITIGDAAGFSLQLQSGLSQPLAEGQRRQRRQIVKAADAPAIEYLQNFWRRLQDFYRQSAQAFGLGASLDNRDSGKSASGMQRGIRILSHRHLRLQANLAASVCQLAADFLRAAKKMLQPGEVNENCIRGGVLHCRRKRMRAIEQRGMRRRFLRR